jgi:hypothetical protein
MRVVRSINGYWGFTVGAWGNATRLFTISSRWKPRKHNAKIRFGIITENTDDITGEVFLARSPLPKFSEPFRNFYHYFQGAKIGQRPPAFFSAIWIDEGERLLILARRGAGGADTLTFQFVPVEITN